MEKILACNKKLFTILGSPRSGSTWFGKVLYFYLQRKHDFQFYYDGYFSQEAYHEIMPDGRWFHYQVHVPGRFYQLPVLDKNGLIHANCIYEPRNLKPSEETKHKIKVLRATKSKILIKQHPQELTAESRKLVLSYPHIFLKRRDTWEQLLSYLLSGHTKSYVIYRGKKLHKVKQKSITAQLLEVARFMKMIKEDDSLITKKTNVIYFEDIPFRNPNILLSNLGLEPILTRKDIESFPVKQQYGNKERFFSNIDKIREIYDSQKNN